MIKHRSVMHKFLLRMGIIFFYVVSFGLFFYIPKIKEYMVNDSHTLNVFTFSEFFTPESIRQFEALYGVKVNVKLYDSNEELFAKFKITGGKGYDIIIPSDYMVEKLRQENLLVPLDHSKISAFESIDSKLLHQVFDPLNEYTIPIQWVTYGILYKKSIFSHDPETIGLQLLFQDMNNLPQGIKPYKIAMFDDAIEAAFLASLLLYGGVTVFDDERLVHIQDLLIKQKDIVASYLGHDIRNFLFADIFQVAITSSMNAKRILDDIDVYDFKIPQEGSLFVIENFAIPNKSQHKELAYTFINFMLSEENSAERSQRFGSNPANRHAYQHINRVYLENKHFFPDQETFSRLHLTHNKIPLKKFEEIWLKVKSR